MREEGYYWVKVNENSLITWNGINLSGEWVIMRWTGTCFWYEDEDYYDNDFDEIDENRIVRNPMFEMDKMKGSDIYLGSKGLPSTDDFCNDENEAWK